MAESEQSKIVVRVDGSTELGMGHVMRCLKLARHLANRIEPVPEVLFVTSEPGEQMEIIQNSGFHLVQPAEPITGNFDLEMLPHLLADLQPELVILDSNWQKFPEALDGIPDETDVLSLHEHNFPVLGNVVGINPSIVNQAPPVGGVIGETHFQGFDYLLLDERIPKLARARTLNPPGSQRVVVCLGGADPEGWTLEVVKTLTAVAEVADIEIQVLLGDAFPPNIHKEIEMIEGIEIHASNPDAIQFLSEADVAVVNGATTMFETIALGVPSIAVPRNDYEREQVEICVKAGAVLGIQGPPTREELSKSLEKVLSDAAFSEKLSVNGMKLIDGGGIGRVGEIVSLLLNR